MGVMETARGRIEAAKFHGRKFLPGSSYLMERRESNPDNARSLELRGESAWWFWSWGSAPAKLLRCESEGRVFDETRPSV